MEINLINFKMNPVIQKYNLKERIKFDAVVNHTSYTPLFISLEVKYVSIDDIIETEEPELENGERAFDKDLIQAIENGKLIDSIWCDKNLEIINGHHRFELARRQGLKTIPVLVGKEKLLVCCECQKVLTISNLRIKARKNYCIQCYS